MRVKQQSHPTNSHCRLLDCIVDARFAKELVKVVAITSLFVGQFVGSANAQQQRRPQQQQQQPQRQRQLNPQQGTQSSATRFVLTDVEQKFSIVDNKIVMHDETLPEKPTGELGFVVLKGLCDIGPRISTSEGMSLQQELIKDHFEKLGATVTMQPFDALHPIDRVMVQLSNMIVRFHPERRLRVLICCHYDTRPFPDRDKVNPRGVFLGANDGASGVGMLCELGRYMPALESEYGVDFVFFDGEEFVYERPRDPLFLGSTYFARNYVANPPSVLYSAGVLVDMIGDSDLNLHLEKHSFRRARTVTKQIWDTAEEEGIREFIPRTRYEINDDHLPLMDIARIPTCDIIDFDYPKGRENIYWHTEADTPDKCSAESLGKVATVVLAWLKKIRSP